VIDAAKVAAQVVKHAEEKAAKHDLAAKEAEEKAAAEQAAHEVALATQAAAEKEASEKAAQEAAEAAAAEQAAHEAAKLSAKEAEEAAAAEQAAHEAAEFAAKEAEEKAAAEQAAHEAAELAAKEAANEVAHAAQVTAESRPAEEAVQQAEPYFLEIFIADRHDSAKLGMLLGLGTDQVLVDRLTRTNDGLPQRAEIAGIEVGDKLVSVNGSVVTPASASGLIRNASYPLKFGVMRGGSTAGTFQCEFDCKYHGSFESVSAHELICEHRPPEDEDGDDNGKAEEQYQRQQEPTGGGRLQPGSPRDEGASRPQVTTHGKVHQPQAHYRRKPRQRRRDPKTPAPAPAPAPALASAQVEMFQCLHDCGFHGSHDAVTSHELDCKLRPTN
jgi:chemotaxis protein histidine kinase CheA